MYGMAMGRLRLCCVVELLWYDLGGSQFSADSKNTTDRSLISTGASCLTRMPAIRTTRRSWESEIQAGRAGAASDARVPR
jgi:hypothetical protein